MDLSRRQVLRLSAGAAATWLTGTALAPSRAATTAEKIPVGLELWSVRQQCEKELPAVLQAVGKMGYTSVELRTAITGTMPPRGASCSTRTA